MRIVQKITKKSLMVIVITMEINGKMMDDSNWMTNKT